MCLVKRSCNQFGDRCFATTGPTLLNCAWTASATGHHLRTIQTIAENVYVWLVRPRRPVCTLRVPTRNLLTYLYVNCGYLELFRLVFTGCCLLWKCETRTLACTLHSFCVRMLSECICVIDSLTCEIEAASQ